MKDASRKWAGNYILEASFMSAQEKIDNFIGFFPDLLKDIYLVDQYKVYNNLAQNNAYWVGYLKAKTELRNKLYEKENIPIPPEQTLYFPDENMSIYLDPLENKL
jgi:hypothetical protein